MSDKIINTFQERRRLAQAFDALAATRTEAELTAQARAIVHEFPTELVLAGLLKLLDTPQSQLRGGLGHVAALLQNADEVGQALRSAVANRQNSPEARITAALILERFLGQTLPGALISDLNDSNEVAFQSLREAIEEGRTNRHILLEYVTQMRETESSVALMVMELLARLEPGDRVELLRLIAQDDRPLVAREALHRLEQLATTTAAAQTARCLHSLQFSLPPELAAYAERALRKLQFNGVLYHPPAPVGWRGLLSPADPGGSQTLWLLRMPISSNEMGALVGAVVNLRAGLVHGFASETVTVDHVPSPHGIGELVPVNTGGPTPSAMLEIPFDCARWLLLKAQGAHWDGTAVVSFPDELKLYNDLLWQFAAPVVDQRVPGLLDGDLGWVEPAIREEELLRSIDLLLEHPAMVGWVRRNPVILNMLELSGERLVDLPADAVSRHLLRMLASWEGHTQVLAAMTTGLRGQALWLYLSGDEPSAGRAARLAAATAEMTIEDNPFFAALLTLAIESMRKANKR